MRASANKKMSKPPEKIKYSALNKEFEHKQKLAYESYMHDLQCRMT